MAHLSSSFTCCYKCESRTLGCHSKCDIYINEKAQYETNKQMYKQSLNPVVRKGSFLGDDGLCKYRPGNYR